MTQSLVLVEQELGYVQHVLKAGLVSETDLFFMAVVERGTGGNCALLSDSSLSTCSVCISAYCGLKSRT